MRRLGILAAMLAAPVSIGAAGVPAVTHPPCAVAVEVSVFVDGIDWYENAGFDGLGHIWLSNYTQDRLEKRDAYGELLTTVPLRTPGAIRLGPDGMLYANFGDDPVRNVALGPGGVVRFDPSNPVPSLFAGGFQMANGAAFDQNGNLYVSNTAGTGIHKVRSDGTLDDDWTARADVFGANGLVTVGEDLYANVLPDQRSPVIRIPLAHPEAHHPVAALSFGAVTLQPALEEPDPSAPLLMKGIDDLDAGGDGRLYIAAAFTGELLRLDPVTGDTCVLLSGLVGPTSVRFAQQLGGFDAERDLFVTQTSGNILVVRLLSP